MTSELKKHWQSLTFEEKCGFAVLLAVSFGFAMYEFYCEFMKDD